MKSVIISWEWDSGHRLKNTRSTLFKTGIIYLHVTSSMNGALHD